MNENVITEEYLLELYSIFAEENGSAASCMLLSKLLVSTLQCVGEKGYETEFSSGKVTVKLRE